MFLLLLEVLNFLIVGENAGSKLEKARKNNIKIINENIGSFIR